MTRVLGAERCLYRALRREQPRFGLRMATQREQGHAVVTEEDGDVPMAFG